VEAVRHAQATQDWELAGRLLADHWLDATLGGQAATAYQLVVSFPACAVTANAELAAVAAAASGLSRGVVFPLSARVTISTAVDLFTPSSMTAPVAVMSETAYLTSRGLSFRPDASLGRMLILRTVPASCQGVERLESSAMDERRLPACG